MTYLSIYKKGDLWTVSFYEENIPVIKILSFKSLKRFSMFFVSNQADATVSNVDIGYGDLTLKRSSERSFQADNVILDKMSISDNVHGYPSSVFVSSLGLSDNELGSLFGLTRVLHERNIRDVQAIRSIPNERFLYVDAQTFSALQVDRVAAPFLKNAASRYGKNFILDTLRFPPRSRKTIEKRIQLARTIEESFSLRAILQLRRHLSRINGFESLLLERSSALKGVLSLFRVVEGLINVVKYIAAKGKSFEPFLPLLSNGESLKRVMKLYNTLAEIVDTNASRASGRLVFHSGISDEYDELADSLKSVGSYLDDVAEKERRHLGAALRDANMQVVYQPSVGRCFIAVRTLNRQEIPPQLEGLYFRYSQRLEDGSMCFYYNSERTEEAESVLNRRLTRLHEVELGIVSRGIAIPYNRLRDSGFLDGLSKEVSLLDFSLSSVVTAAEGNMSFPEFERSEADSVSLEIVDGWNLLNPGENVVPNSLSINSERNIKILTGPNSSGKTSFMVQNAHILLLAHCGLPLPCKSFVIKSKRLIKNIAICSSIEDVGTDGPSSFHMEMNTVRRMLSLGDLYSFYLLDEVGKGTAPLDGEAIFVSIINTLSTGERRPLCIMSTHFDKFIDHPGAVLRPNRTEFIKMEIVMDKGPVFLYKVGKGISNSLGINILGVLEFDAESIHRAKEIRSGRWLPLESLSERERIRSSLVDVFLSDELGDFVSSFWDVYMQ